MEHVLQEIKITPPPMNFVVGFPIGVDVYEASTHRKRSKRHKKYLLPIWQTGDIQNGKPTVEPRYTLDIRMPYDMVLPYEELCALMLERVRAELTMSEAAEIIFFSV